MLSQKDDSNIVGLFGWTLLVLPFAQDECVGQRRRPRGDVNRPAGEI